MCVDVSLEDDKYNTGPRSLNKSSGYERLAVCGGVSLGVWVELLYYISNEFYNYKSSQDVLIISKVILKLMGVIDLFAE